MAFALRRSKQHTLVRGILITVALGSLGLISLATGSTACIPDPKGDFQDFKDRTANLGTAPTDTASPSDAAPIDSKPPETAVEGLYAGICVTSLAAGDPEQALRFYTETKYTPNSANPNTGTLILTVTPLVGWDVATGAYLVPTTFSKSQTRGNPIAVPEINVEATGRFTAKLGTVNLAAEANSVSGRTAVIENTVLDGLFSAGDRFCSTLAGELTVPYRSPFDPKQNTCLFVRAKEGDAFPKIPANEFTCKF